MKKRNLIVISVLLLFAFGCSLATGGSPTMSTAPAPTMERVYAAPSVIPSPSATPNIVSPTTVNQVDPTVDWTEIASQTPAVPTICEKVKSFTTVIEAMEFLDADGLSVSVPNGQVIPAPQKGKIIVYWSRSEILAHFEGSTYLRQEKGGTILKLTVESVFTVSGSYREYDACE